MERTSPPGSGNRIEDELTQLSRGPWKLGESHRKLYRAIRYDPSADAAFEKLTTGPRSIRPVILLLNLQIEAFSRGTPRQDWKEWAEWNDKWNDLGRTAKSLNRIASKMEKQIQRNQRGPIALPTLLPTTEGTAEDQERKRNTESKRYTESVQANHRLEAIVGSLRANASEIDRFCQMRRDWLGRMPRKHRDTIQNERHMLLLRFVEAETGEPHFKHLATLINICNKTLRRPNTPQISADYLRKLSNRFSTPLVKLLHPTRE